MDIHLISTVFSYLILLTGLGVIVYTIKFNDNMEKKRRSLYLLRTVVQDDHYQESLMLLDSLHNTKQCHSKTLGARRSETRVSEIQSDASINYLMRHFEQLAIKIKHEFYCEYLLKSTYQQAVIQTFEHVAPVIRHAREESSIQAYYHYFEWLYQRWVAGSEEKMLNREQV